MRWPKWDAGPALEIREANVTSKKSVGGGRSSKRRRGELGPGERRLEETLASLVTALDELGAQWMLIGGLAVITKGVRRTTTDIDAVVRGDEVDEGRLASVLADHGIHPRVADAQAFARANLVYLARHAETGVDLDISLAWSGFEHEALAARTHAAFGHVTVPMARTEDLIVLKVVAGRPQDLSDVQSLLLLSPDIDLDRVRRRTRELSTLAEAPEIGDQLEALITRMK